MLPTSSLPLGYERRDGSNFVLSGEAGIELFTHELMTVDLSARATSFFGKGGPDVALVSPA